VQLSGYVGEVLSISARTTVLRTRDGSRVHIRNLDVLDIEIVVLTAFIARRLSVPLSVDQRWDIGAVSELLVAAVGSVPMVLPEPPPRVIVSSLSGGVLELLVQVWFEPQTYSDAEVTDAVARSLQPAPRREGIELVPPRLRVQNAEALDHAAALQSESARPEGS
jgi:small-conductance mechanosensitive channel